ncbi:hypothetical protein [Bacillus sp. OK048]|uniref:hypothetical protein n=1 Tax=Bacillus sp. OK048 TaxID=1882761 RepID=UPI0008804B2A|nr:hypothetical protein [Bacillus sp. OK048]SDN32464.1 hypothetical protein SAMN05443253_11094 [Bacillus sp. OK048]
MNRPISIFILDVSNSSSPAMGEKLTNYLDDLVYWINIWTKEVVYCKVKHRAGDEIIFVGYGYSTAYILAFFISRIWKFKDHPPYFGFSFGDIDKELEAVDIEKWIHPLIKQARYANDLLKQEQGRPLFKFELDQFYENKTLSSYNLFRNEFEILINSLLRLQMTMLQEQTHIQEQVCTYYLILQQQKAAGALLGKTAPTISSHFKKGKSGEILNVFGELITILNSLQEKSYVNDQGNVVSDSLKESIRNHLKENLNKVISQ